MTGQQQQPEQLFYTFQLERPVPSDHLLRHIDAILDQNLKKFVRCVTREPPVPVKATARF